MKKRMYVIAMTAVLLFSLVACGSKSKGADQTETPEVVLEEAAESTPSTDDEKTENLEDELEAEDVDKEDAAEESVDDSVVDENPADASEEEPKDVTTAQEIWRVYEVPDASPASNPYLYLDIYPADGYVSFQFDFMGNNIYASGPWPMESGEYWATEFDGMGGGEPFKVYIDYSEDLIKVYGYYNDNTERDEYPTELVFSNEDILK